MYNVTLRRVNENTVPVESNKYYIFLYVSVCARALASMWARVRARTPVCVGADTRECACTRVGLLIHYAKRRRHITRWFKYDRNKL
jgi:hypothetical protein